MRRLRNRVLLWLSEKFSHWSYRLCDLSNTFSRLAAPPRQDWVPLSEFDRVLRDVLVQYYKDVLESPTFLFDKVREAKKFETVKSFTWRERS